MLRISARWWFPTKYSFRPLKEKYDLDLLTFICLLNEFTWMASVQLSNCYFRFDEYTCILSNYHLCYICRSWCRLHIYVDTNNSSGQNRIPCCTPNTDTTEPQEDEECRGDNLLNDWSVYFKCFFYLIFIYFICSCRSKTGAIFCAP